MPAQMPRVQKAPETPTSNKAMIAQTDMRMYGETDAGNYYLKQPKEPPVHMPAPEPPCFDVMPGMEEAGRPVDTNERINALLAQAKADMHVMPPEDVSPIGQEAPLPLMEMPAPMEKTKQERKLVSPELIEVLSLSDVSKCGVEDGLLGEGSGRKGVLGKGVWWRVEQPGVQDWHYLAGELTAKNGARVRAIALEAECDELPEHLKGWAQRIENYFVVLIDCKTGTVLPESAC